ncbi:MAG: TolC family protein [Bacteroidales bacterium]|jgi:outer membrane protein|nr:TolC family protein [Bacteroidales bacterium]
MKSIQLLVITILSITLSISSQAQKVWTLEDCINYAIENNITVKREELSADAADKAHFQSLMELLPNANTTGNHYINSGKTLNTETYTYEDQTYQGGRFNISSELTIFNGLQNFNTIRKNKLDLLAQLESVEKVKNDITLNVATSYLQILLNKELRDNAQQQIDITIKQIEKTKTLYEIGNASKGDLLQIQSQAAGEKAALTDAENNLKISYLDLVQLLYLEDPNNFDIVIPEILDITLGNNITTVNDVYNDALAFLPEIKSAELYLKSSEMNLAISYGSISPSLTFGYQYQSRYNELATNIADPGSNYPYLEQIGDNASQAIYLALRIPLFNNWRTGNSINQAKISLNDAGLFLDLQKQNLYKDIQLVKTQAIASLDRYKANLEAVKAMEEAFRYTEQKYQVGLVDILEYNTAKNQLNKSNSDLAQAKYEYIFRTKILEFYRGEQITL